MRLQDIVLFESTTDLNNKGSIDRLAQGLHERGFPEDFHVSVKSGGKTFPLTFALEDKKINEEKGYHTVIFVYELDSKSSKLVHDAITKAEHDEELYDQLSEDLKVDKIEVYVDIGQHIGKVFGHAY